MMWKCKIGILLQDGFLWKGMIVQWSFASTWAGDQFGTNYVYE